MQKEKIPKALFNSKALFNPYQYLPFEKILKWDDNTGKYVTGYENDSEALVHNLLITDEVGVGKTFETGIILREMLENNPDLTVLILCPLKLCNNWEKELNDNFFIGAENYYNTKIMGQITILPYSFFNSKSGSNINESAKYEIKLQTDDLEDLGVDNKKIEMLKDILPYDILILDEAHYIRNKKKLWRYVEKIIEESETETNGKTKIFMTGTPVFNSTDDYKNLTELLSVFNQKFAVTKTLQSEANCYDKLLKIQICGGRKGIIVDDNSVEKQIIDELYSEIDDENNRLKSKYGKMTGFLKRIASSSFYSLKMFVEDREEFFSNDFIDDDFESCDYNNDLISILDGWYPENDIKLNALKRLLEEKKNNTENNRNFKAVIFSCYITTCKYLENKLKSDYHVYTILGSTKSEDVENNKLRFEKDTEPAVLICSDAAKEGHNLQFCQYLIHYDLPYTPAAIGQRNGRIYRKGQEGLPEAIYMLLSDGYDKRLFGEIIVNKCEIIKNTEISWINILPDDASEYIESCIKNYIEDKLSEDENKLNAAGRLLKNRFYSADEDKWTYDKAKTLYDKIKEISSQKIDDTDEINIEEKIFSLFSIENNTSKSLKKIYENQYNEKVFCFLKKYFDYEPSENESSTDAFINACREAVGKQENKYCHDMLSDELLTATEYKKQFKPLLKVEEDVNENK